MYSICLTLQKRALTPTREPCPAGGLNPAPRSREALCFEAEPLESAELVVIGLVAHDRRLKAEVSSDTQTRARGGRGAGRSGLRCSPSSGLRRTRMYSLSFTRRHFPPSNCDYHERRAILRQRPSCWEKV
ncbi:hypothetical protein EYF80_057378 [Liparis tanakae]|uniref:Uncharacterized protein n=1 Tax=Liparis tanakae TaxID=230148 RepID=A0A4Z2EUM1_9TELE|nr:hypothetical protein EYF80_057378 [Liparis tanakae]